MDGDGGETVGYRQGAAGFDLPAVLAQLDDHDPTAQYEAVRTIRERVDDRPDACIPSVPKLRALLERPSIDFHDEVAYCLAELAAVSADDVAPSSDEIAAFVAENEPSAATRELLRCLATVADERPDAVVDHAATIADVLEARQGYDRWGLRALAHVSESQPAALEPAVPVLSDALAADPEENGIAALSALGRIARSNATLPSLAFVDHALELVDHDDGALRNNAIGCLGDVAHHNPAAVEAGCPRVATALESADPNTRANAAVTLARVAAGSDAAIESAEDRLLALLADDHATARANACLAVGYGDLEDARERLETLATDDPEQTVRERAAWALERIETPATVRREA